MQEMKRIETARLINARRRRYDRITVTQPEHWNTRTNVTSKATWVMQASSFPFQTLLDGLVSLFTLGDSSYGLH